MLLIIRTSSSWWYWQLFFRQIFWHFYEYDISQPIMWTHTSWRLPLIKEYNEVFFMSLLRFILWVLNFTQYVTRHLLVVTALCKPLQLRHIESLCWKTIPTTITIKNVCRKICADVTRLQLCCCTYHISCLRTNKV